MSRAPTKLERARRWWLALQLPLALALLAILSSGGGVQAWIIELLPYPHGLIKGILQTWHVLMLRAGGLPWWWALAWLLGIGLVVLPKRWTWRGGVLLSAASLALPGASWLARGVLALLLMLNLLPWHRWERAGAVMRGLGWIPGLVVLLPTPLVARRGTAPRWAPLMAPVLLLPLWFLGDAAIAREAYLPGLIHWPDARVDPRVDVLERATVMRGEYHDIELSGDHAVVVAEDSCRLLAVPLHGGETQVHQLSPRWPPFQAGALDSWIDPDGLAWLLTAPNELSGLRLSVDGWAREQSRRFPGPCNFAYLVPAPDIERLLMVFVNAHDREPGGIVPFELPSVRPLERLKLERADGSWFPTPRDAAWVPPLGRLVLTPNFGEWLALADPATGLVEPWLELYSANAKPLWVPGLERLLLARPDAASIAVIEPISGTVERSIPTQRGVRALAVDHDRGLLVTGSVLTGRVEVQRLEDGEVLDSFGTLMPMIREIALDTERGEAIVATWTVLYRLPYVALD